MAFHLNKSTEAFNEAKQYIPGGVNSPVRSFRGVGGTPPFIARAAGSRLYDIDSNQYIDYVGSWGPMILGHAHPAVVEALAQAVSNGTSYGAPTLLETTLAKLVQQAVPSMELIRMVNSGTEATMSVLRLARAYTKRSKIVKFIGCYHGHHDSLLVKAGSGAATLGVPDSPGVSDAVAGGTISVNYNDISALTEVFSQYGEEIAAVIIEPVAGNMGMVLPQEGYLAAVREITQRYGSLLIFDEVMTGFRVAYSGAQSVFGIKPDLTCLGKIIGGGLPVGAYGGRQDIMELISPAGPVYQAGTLSGNPLAMTAGITTLTLLSQTPGLYEKLAEKTKTLCAGIRAQGEKYGFTLQYHQLGAMFGMFFTDQPVYDYESAKQSDIGAFNTFFHAMLEQGVYMAPSQFEAGFMSAAHSEEDIAATIAASGYAFAKVAEYHKNNK
ncbi:MULTISPECIES: glutamate-1-semialdehyde 2,1-aminomutase [Pelosinus]|uniref:Glutamate-1-semialdehyde 2,1-aminomutase n=1 Tax=Pelosinus fermentans B4 TaxID=1149862 RepID=I8RGC5_9FIRM|nr:MULTISPECIES: glutamate-1-semialdehyde 2,1-aminomutase [Pelosinus]EIW18683.1 glutamate-1-semialdehyde-2,1-aminomutase [Pelosinus fermentans B4]EIW25200.1 Glutamate-1-semialdehyde 2,1-aminomutase [Pelosinus fermentans A11]OAM96468.1 Glutamate-1-semialdehyde 2,1-aminomutase [Pelosinus fermentans DSM 17108]SDR40485.1 glutamate-1-semialdehyde 2,1-aminomutase [Pelosinus fermentans]